MFEPGTARRADSGVLPSRAADNLFWLGRYIERTEGAIRLLRAYHLRLAETGASGDPRLARIEQLLQALFLTTNRPLRSVLEPSLSAARVSAGKVRDRFSVDGWTALADLTNSLEAISETLAPGDDSVRLLTLLLRKITGFNGLVHENMHRSSGWRFLTFGRALERADGAASVLAMFGSDDASPGLPDVVLEFGDSMITHQRRYRIDPTRETVLDLLALDRQNPRALLYQVQAMRQIAEDLPHAEIHGQVSDVLRLLLPLETDLTVARPTDLDAAKLQGVRATLEAVSSALSTGYFA